MIEEIPAIQGAIVYAPEATCGWQANVLFETSLEQPAGDPTTALARLCETLAHVRPGLHFRNRSLKSHPSGSPIALVESDSLQDGIALTQWDAVWDVALGHRIVLTAASECTLWPVYEPVFDSILASFCALDQADIGLQQGHVAQE